MSGRVTVVFTFTLILTLFTGAFAATEKVLYSFAGGADGCARGWRRRVVCGNRCARQAARRGRSHAAAAFPRRSNVAASDRDGASSPAQQHSADAHGNAAARVAAAAEDCRGAARDRRRGGVRFHARVQHPLPARDVAGGRKPRAAVAADAARHSGPTGGRSAALRRHPVGCDRRTDASAKLIRRSGAR